jgi:S1-C subfamily serine protease
VRDASGVAAAGLKVGDVLIEVGGEPFIRGRGLPHLRAWLMRELRSDPQPFALRVTRAGAQLTMTAQLALGPYSNP